jgi:hypothetical protein
LSSVQTVRRREYNNVLPDRQNNANENKREKIIRDGKDRFRFLQKNSKRNFHLHHFSKIKKFSGAKTSHTGARVTSLKALAQNELHVNDGRVSASLTQVVFVRASLILLRPGPWDEWQEAGVTKRRIPYGRIQNPFLITQV